MPTFQGIPNLPPRLVRARDPPHSPGLVGPDRVGVRHAGTLGLGRPVLSAMAGYIHGQLQPAPDAKFIERATQMVLDDLFAGANDFADFAIGQTFPRPASRSEFPSE